MSVAVLQTPLAKFAHDVFTLYRPDRLHQSNRGVAEELTKIAEAKLRASERVQLNKYIASLAFFQGLKVPSFGMNTSQKATATELAELFKVLPVALVAFAATPSTILNARCGDCCNLLACAACCVRVMLCHLNANAQFATLLADVLEFQTLRDLEVHTEATLAALDQARKRRATQLLHSVNELCSSVPVLTLCVVLQGSSCMLAAYALGPRW